MPGLQGGGEGSLGISWGSRHMNEKGRLQGVGRAGVRCGRGQRSGGGLGTAGQGSEDAQAPPQGGSLPTVASEGLGRVAA